MKVSIITVSYNSSLTIERTINSVFNQNYPDIEHIIVDGKSYDETYNIIQNNIKKISKFICEEDSGIYNAMNKGIKASSGDIICILNSDDVYTNKDVISKIVKEFSKKNGYEIIFSNIKFFKYVKSNFIITRIVKASHLSLNKFRFGWVPPHPGMFVKKGVYQKLGFYNDAYKNAADYEFFIKIFFYNNFKIYYLNEFTVFMLEGGKSNGSLLSLILNTNEIIKACLNNGIYTNFLLLIIRLPIKIIQKYMITIFENKNV